MCIRDRLGALGKDAQPLCKVEGLKVVSSDSGETMAEVKDGQVAVLASTKATDHESCLNSSHQV